MYLQSVVLIICVIQIEALKLPTYIKPCAKNDPNLNECALKSARAAIPKFANGDRRYNIRSLNPLIINHLVIDHGSGGAVGLKMSASNLTLTGLEKTEITNITLDPPNRQFDWTLYVPVINLVAKYTINGRILLVPISGTGDVTMRIIGFEFKLKYWHDLETRKDGKEYMKITKSEVNHKLKRVHIKADGLFNNNKLLGEQMNRFLNENWKEIADELGPNLAEIVQSISDGITNAILPVIPYNVILPDKI